MSFVRMQRSRAVHRAVRQGAGWVWRDFRLRDLYQSGRDFELTGRATGFAALAMLTVIPLLIVVAAASAVWLAALPGAVGTVLIEQSWLIGVGWVIYGGPLFGRWFPRRLAQGPSGQPAGPRGAGRRGKGPAGTRRPDRTSWVAGSSNGQALFRLQD
jgi:hypothetical protein